MHIRNIDGCKAKMSIYVPYLRLVLLICADYHLEILRNNLPQMIKESKFFKLFFISDTLYIYYSHCLFSVRWQYTSSNCIYFVIYMMNDMVRNKLVICLWVFTQTTNTTCVDKWHYQRNLPKITRIMKRSCYTAECCASIFPSRAPIPFRTLKVKKSIMTYE